MVARKGHSTSHFVLQLPCNFYFPLTSTSVQLLLPCNFHFCPTSTSTKLQRYNVTQERDAHAQNIIKLYCESAAMPLQLRVLDEEIRFLFTEGYPYKLILCFLAAVYTISISLSTLKRSLRRQNLRRRGVRNNIWQVGKHLLVSLLSSRWEV